MEEVDSLIKTMAEYIERDIKYVKHIDEMSERTKALAELITARAAMVGKLN